MRGIDAAVSGQARGRRTRRRLGRQPSGRESRLKTYRVGIVGLGRIASLYENDRKARRYYPALTHAGSFSRHPRTEIAAACDTNLARARAFGRTWGVEVLYQDCERMLADQPLDILSICTQPDSHLRIVEQSAGRVPLIFCEKPMGRNLAEAARIVELCRRRGSRLAVNLYRLFDPSHLQVGKRIGRGEIGSIQRVNCYYGKGLRNMGSHLISLLQQYFGPIERVRTAALHRDGDGPEATADFTAEFKAGFSAVVQSCDFRRYRIFEVDVLGDKGRITLDREGFGFHFYRAAANRAESAAKELVRRPSRITSTVGRALHFAIDNLVATLDGKGALRSSGDTYLQTERVLAAVMASARRQGRWVRA